MYVRGQVAPAGDARPLLPRPVRRSRVFTLPQHEGDAPWLLDLFCCAGGAGVGYWRAGFNVIGVDIERQPRYPFTFCQADALDILAGQVSTLGIAAIHASPPCQHYSNAQRIRSNDHLDLIGPTRDLLDDIGLPYIIENVEGAKDQMIDPVRLCGAMFPELRVYRHRLFESNIGLKTPAHPKHTHRQTKMGRTPVEGEFIHVVGNFAGVDYARAAMDIPWMSRDELKEAIPPAYTTYLGSQLMAYLEDAERKDSHPTDGRSAHPMTRKQREAEESEQIEASIRATNEECDAERFRCVGVHTGRMGFGVPFARDLAGCAETNS